MVLKLGYDEAELLARIAEGDQRAFEIIYDRYHARIYQFAIAYLRNEMDSEEIVQEIFLKLWMRDGRSSPIENLPAYFQILTRNHSLNALRRKARINSTDLEASVNWIEDDLDTEHHILLNDTRRVLNQAIELLPPQQRIVYQLCHVQGLKYEDVAKQLNISPGTVHSHVKSALKFLREYLRSHTDIAVLLIIFKLF
ncbi:RNA polymerase sigma factor [Pedobacter deserti]|uniref:RNA polymerase sigma factor n=1 Tax=Pedobacter deserti TaxID=2817382 RepID=UPI00210E441E|nr:RNA polymerase sigma-70 factor [Pedobacter sp. SYSU D00382]